MSIQCPRCQEQIDGVPSGCRDPACPRIEIEALEREQYAAIMASVKAESDSNVAYGAAKDAVIAAARAVDIALDQSVHVFVGALEQLRVGIAALDTLEKQP